MASTQGLTLFSSELNHNFMVYQMPWYPDNSAGNLPNILAPVIEDIYAICGVEAAKKTMVLIIPYTQFSAPGWAEQFCNLSVLLMPNITLSGKDVSSLYRNKLVEQYFSYPEDPATSKTNNPGLNCGFKIKEIPEFEFKGIHLKDNPIVIDYLTVSGGYSRVILDAPSPGSGRAGSDVWSTFFVNGYDSTFAVSNLQVSAAWVQSLVAKYNRRVQYNVTVSVFPSPNIDVGSGSGGATTLSALTDVSISGLPALHKTTRLSYVPSTSLWQNTPILQLHQWEYTAGYGVTPSGTFKLDSATISLATNIKINKESQAVYEDAKFLEGALDPSRYNYLRLTFNTYGVVFELTGTYVDLGTEIEFPCTMVDIWGNAPVYGDIVQFDAVGNFVYDATNMGGGVGLYEGRNGKSLEIKTIDTGLGLAGSTSVGNALTLSLNAYLDDLLDVDLTTPPTLNQILQYDGSDWKAATVSVGALNNFTAVIDPTATDDNTQGYSVGSQWMNVNHNQVFFCADATTNGAIWVVSTNDYNQHSVRGNFTASIIAGTHGVVIGDGASILSGNDVVAIGHGAGVDGQGSVGIGHTVDVQADDCVAIGEFATCAVNDGTAVGKSSQSSGRGHIALGSGAITTATEKLALGFDGQNNVNVSGVFQRLPVSIDGTARQVLMRDTDLAFDDLTDVVVTSATSGNTVQYDGTNFVNIMRDNWITGLKYPAGINAVATVTQTTWHIFISDITQVVNKCALYLTVGGAANIKCAIYTGRPDGGAGTTLLSETATVGTHTSLAEQEYDFPAPITITKGTTYSFAVSQVTGNSIGVFNGLNGPISVGRYNLVNYTVTGFPANLGAVAFTNISTVRFVACLR